MAGKLSSLIKNYEMYSKFDLFHEEIHIDVHDNYWIKLCAEELTYVVRSTYRFQMSKDKTCFFKFSVYTYF